jgi:hypothetical protein
LYKKVLLAYDGSLEGRRALREGARIAQLCGAEVFLPAVAEVSAGAGTLEAGFVIPEQVEIYNKILLEGVERLKAMGFSPTARLNIGEAWTRNRQGRRGSRRKPRRRRPSSRRSAGTVVQLGWNIPSQTSSMQRVGSANRNWRRRICPVAYRVCRGGISIRRRPLLFANN